MAHHILIFPLPIQGAVNPMLKLAELIWLASNGQIQVTFLTTEHVHRRLELHAGGAERFSRHAGFSFRTFADGLPIDHPRGGDKFMEMLDATEKVSQPLIRDILMEAKDKDGVDKPPPVACVIADGLFTFVLDVGRAVGTPVMYFDTISPCCLWVYLCLPGLVQDGVVPFQVAGVSFDVIYGKEMGSVELANIIYSHAYMELAILEAKLALQKHEVPVGCVIVENGKVIASGSNHTNETRNATRHAEMEAIDRLLQQWQIDGLSQSDVIRRLSECVLFVTCEPCIMCAAALSFLGLKEVFYGCANDKFGGCGSILSLNSVNSDHCNISGAKGFKRTGGVMASESVSLFQTFYERGNPNAPKPHRAVVQP